LAYKLNFTTGFMVGTPLLLPSSEGGPGSSPASPSHGGKSRRSSSGKGTMETSALHNRDKQLRNGDKRLQKMINFL
jgi:hypothetical protein